MNKICGRLYVYKRIAKDSEYDELKKIMRNKVMKDIKCPNCGSKMVEIFYGMPSSDVIDLVKKEEIYLGGCCIFEDEEMPKYHCYKCNRSYYEDLVNFEEEDDCCFKDED